MNRRILSLFVAFLGFTANVVSALNSPFSKSIPDEVERLKEKLLKNAPTDRAVLLLPGSTQSFGRFLWLTAHGSHSSHSSHASHASHASHSSGTSHYSGTTTTVTTTPGTTTTVTTIPGTTSHRSGSSCSVVSPIPKIFSSDLIPGMKDTKLIGIKNLPMILHLPSSTLDYPSLEYKVVDIPLHGSLDIDSDGLIIYSPDPGVVTNDRFSILATDGFSFTNPVYFDINIKEQ